VSKIARSRTWSNYLSTGSNKVDRWTWIRRRNARSLWHAIPRWLPIAAVQSIGGVWTVSEMEIEMRLSASPEFAKLSSIFSFTVYFHLLSDSRW